MAQLQEELVQVPNIWLILFHVYTNVVNNIVD